MEEERNIKVSLEEAIEWYYSDNAELRRLARTAYTEDELKFDINYIHSRVHTTRFTTAVPENEKIKYDTLADLGVIAKYFNGNWKKTTDEPGYFISNYKNVGTNVTKHTHMQHAGIVYFKNKKDAIQAIKILGERVKNLFI